MKSNHQVLLGSAGVGAAYATAKALRKYFNVKIIVADTNPSYLVTSNLISDFFEQIPSIHSNEFNNVIPQIIDRHSIDTYIPYIDLEVYKAALLFENGKINHEIALQIKKSSIASICLDKYNAYIWLKANGFPTPETYTIKESCQLREGHILKPKNGFGSVIHLITKNSYLNFENFDIFIMQEYCDIPEITIDVHYSEEFNFFAYACRERIETKSGVCTKARIFNDPVLGEMALNLAKNLNLSSFCFQVMNLKNEFVITDINPRLGAGTAMSLAVGMDFFGAMFSTLWGSDPKPFFTNITEDKYVTRQYSEFVM